MHVSIRRSAMLAAGTIALASMLACSSGPKYPAYSPHENLLSIATEFQLLASVDPYRDEPGRDLTGQNAARAAMIRLSNYEALQPGQFVPEIHMLRGRALEWLGDFGAAEREYMAAAEFDTEMRVEATRRATALRRLIAIGIADSGSSLGERLIVLERRSDAFAREATETDDPFIASLSLREQETADVERAELLASNSMILPDGDEQALAALTRVVARHTASTRALEHALRLARFHVALAHQEAYLNPPTGSTFDVDRFRRHYQAGLDLLYRISQADGRHERIIARHELDALLALGEMVNQRAG